MGNSSTRIKLLAVLFTAIFVALAALVITGVRPADATDCSVQTPEFCTDDQYGGGETTSEPTAPEATTPENTSPTEPGGSTIETSTPTTSSGTTSEPTTGGTTVATTPPANGGTTSTGGGTTGGDTEATDGPRATDGTPQGSGATGGTEPRTTGGDIPPRDGETAPSGTVATPSEPNSPGVPNIQILNPGPPATVAVEVPAAQEPVNVSVPDLDGNERVTTSEISAAAVGLVVLTETGDRVQAVESAQAYVPAPDMANAAVVTAEEASADNGLQLEALPDTSGISLLLPVGALLLGLGLVGWRVFAARI